MSLVRQILSVATGLALIFAGVYLAVVAIQAAISVFSSLNSQVAVAIIAASATVFVSVLSIVLGKVYDRREQINREIRERKIPVYEDLIRFMFRVLMGEKTGNAPTEKEMLEFFLDFTQRIVVWGSDDVFMSWSKWKRHAARSTDKGSQAKSVFLYEDLLKAIRQDLGHKNKGFKQGDILAIFITDIDTVLGVPRI
jgi:membrane protein implicated in regulation of membrane protease activity